MKARTFGDSSVRRGILYHRGKRVYRGGRRDAHDFVFKDASFAMTKTYYMGIRKELIHFKRLPVRKHR